MFFVYLLLLLFYSPERYDNYLYHFYLLLALTATGSIPLAISGIFQSFIYSITELLPTILIISIIVSMSNLLVQTGINDTMISPFTKMIRTPTLAYWIIGLLMMTISFFFWPSPAVALMGAILLPVAVRVGLPPIGVAIAMNLFGHGIALSGDFVIQGAPKLTADAAGLPVSSVVSASVPLVIVMGVVTTSFAFSSYEKSFIQEYRYKTLFHQRNHLKLLFYYLLA